MKVVPVAKAAGRRGAQLRGGAADIGRRRCPASSPSQGGLSLQSIADPDVTLARWPRLRIPRAEIEADAPQHGFVRVDVARLDEAVERLSALIVNRFRMNRAIAKLAQGGVDTRELAQIQSENGRQLRDLRGAIFRVRMVPIAELLERIPLLVRGLRRTVNRLVRVEIDAGKTEVDKAVAERLFPALVHLVRNAVDHAIESPEERRAPR